MSIQLLITLLLIIIWCLVIFNFSNMSGKESQGKSRELTEKLVKTIFKIINKKVKEEKMNKIVDTLNGILRKCMHASEYFVLGVLIYYCCKILEIESWTRVVIPIVLSFIYACSDEFHQLFIDGRSCRFTDVLIDTAGASIGVILVNIISNIL